MNEELLGSRCLQGWNNGSITLFEVYGHGDSKEDIGTIGKFNSSKYIHLSTRYMET